MKKRFFTLLAVCMAISVITLCASCAPKNPSEDELPSGTASGTNVEVESEATSLVDMGVLSDDDSWGSVVGLN